MLKRCAFFFIGTLRDIGLLLSSLASFVASTRLIRSGAGAIDSPKQFCQTFDQYDKSGVPEKIYSDDFSMAGREKMFIFGIFKLYISNFAYYNLYQSKLKAITRKKYDIHFLIRTLDFSLEFREDESDLDGSPKKNVESVNKHQWPTSSA